MQIAADLILMIS